MTQLTLAPAPEPLDRPQLSADDLVEVKRPSQVFEAMLGRGQKVHWEGDHADDLSYSFLINYFSLVFLRAQR